MIIFAPFISNKIHKTTIMKKLIVFIAGLYGFTLNSYSQDIIKGRDRNPGKDTGS